MNRRSSEAGRQAWSEYEAQHGLGATGGHADKPSATGKGMRSMTKTAFQIGDRINGKYEIVGQIGSGGHGTVYKATQHPVGRTVALKFISRHLSREPEIRNRFFHEAKALARLNHPSVVTLFDYGEADDRLFMVMEYVEGQEIRELADRRKPIDSMRVMQIAQQVLSALIQAHEIGIVHRDLKPANIMVFKGLSGEGRVQVLDFGIASLRDESLGATTFDGNSALGTPDYCAPEQARGKPVGPAADLYSLGVVMYELLAGRPLFEASSPWMLIDKHLRAPVPILPSELNVPAGLESMVRLALAKEPEARFPDARSMLTRLLEVMADVSGQSSAFNLPTLRELEKLDSGTLARLAAQIEDDVARRSGEQAKQEFVISSAPAPKEARDLRGTLELDPKYMEQIELEMGLTQELPRCNAKLLNDPTAPMPPIHAESSFWLGLTVNCILLASVWMLISAV